MSNIFSTLPTTTSASEARSVEEQYVPVDPAKYEGDLVGQVWGQQEVLDYHFQRRGFSRQGPVSKRRRPQYSQVLIRTVRSDRRQQFVLTVTRRRWWRLSTDPYTGQSVVKKAYATQRPERSCRIKSKRRQYRRRLLLWRSVGRSVCGGATQASSQLAIDLDENVQLLGDRLQPAIQRSAPAQNTKVSDVLPHFDGELNSSSITELRKTLHSLRLNFSAVGSSDERIPSLRGYAENARPR